MEAEALRRSARSPLPLFAACLQTSHYAASSEASHCNTGSFKFADRPPQSSSLAKQLQTCCRDKHCGGVECATLRLLRSAQDRLKIGQVFCAGSDSGLREADENLEAQLLGLL